MCLNAALAQLVEQRFCKAKVLGSNPRGGSFEKFNNSYCLTSGFAAWNLKDS